MSLPPPYVPQAIVPLQMFRVMAYVKPHMRETRFFPKILEVLVPAQHTLTDLTESWDVLYSDVYQRLGFLLEVEHDA